MTIRRQGLSGIGYLLVLLLVVSAALGGAILAVDDVLPEYAPTHAMGLLAFAIFDVLLIVVVLVRPKVGFLGAGFFGLIQLVGMLSNLVIGARFGVVGFSQAELTEYLLGTAKELQLGQGFWKLSPFIYDVLLAIQIPLILTAFAAYKSKH